MAILQFWRGSDKECLINNCSEKSYKIVEIGYPFLSFVEDIEIDISSVSNELPHIYWGLLEVKNTNLFAAKMCQSMFRKIFESIQESKTLNLEVFEDIMISRGFEVPYYGIGTYDDNGKNIVCDLYRCFYVPGQTREIIEQLCVAELHYLATNGYTIKRCANCGKLFVPKKADEKYCVRRSEEYPNMNCKQAAKYKKQLSRENNEAAKLYHSVNTMLAKRAKSSALSEIEQRQSELYAFRNQALIWKENIKDNRCTEAEYIAWLHSYKKRR